MVTAYALLLAQAATQAATPAAAQVTTPASVDAAGLATLVAAQGGGQAVVALTDERTVAVGEPKTSEALSAALKANNVRLIPGPVAVAHAEILPDAVMRSVARLRKVDPSKKVEPLPFPAEALAGGKVTLATATGKTLALSSLEAVKWSLPLRLSPAFSNSLVGIDLAVSVKDLGEAEFLGAVAKAVGGRYRTNGKNLLIEPSGGELKTRALRTIDLAARAPRDKAENAMNLSEAQQELPEGTVVATYEVQEGPPGRRRSGGRNSGATTPAAYAAQLDLARAVTNGISAIDFEKWINGDFEAVALDLAGQTNVQDALIRLLRANAVEPPDLARVNRLLATVPPRAPGQVVLGDGYSIEATLNTVDRRGNAGRTVRLKAL